MNTNIKHLSDKMYGISFLGYFLVLPRLFLLFFYTLFHSIFVVFVDSTIGFDKNELSKQSSIWSKNLCRLLNVKVICSGKPQKGVLYLSNHRSYIDIAAILKESPCILLSKAEVASWPVLGWAAKLVNTVFVERDKRDSRKSSRIALKELIENDLSVAVFPEGTTFEGPGILPFKSGMFHLAAENHFRVLPISITYENSSDAWVGNSTFIGHFISCFRKRETKVYVDFGNCMSGNDWENLKTKTEEWIDAKTKFRRMLIDRT